MLMTMLEECQIFWSWGNHDLSYYQQYVGLDALTPEEYKIITGVDYPSVTAPDSQPSIKSQSTSESTSVSA